MQKVSGSELPVVNKHKEFINRFHQLVTDFELLMLEEIDGNPGHITNKMDFNTESKYRLSVLFYKLREPRDPPEEINKQLLLIGMYGMLAYFQSTGKIDFQEWWNAIQNELPEKDRFAELDMIDHDYTESNP